MGEIEVLDSKSVLL